jgi:hypothetical protein
MLADPNEDEETGDFDPFYPEENPLDPYSEDEDLVNDWDRLESELDYEDSPITARNLT